jgi:hypothetical protein
MLHAVSYPEIAHDYDRLRSALENDAYPAERHYLDFKLALYPPIGSDGNPLKGKSKDKIHAELAQDMASFGSRGGHLIYGVREDKAQHRFHPVEMDLPAHIELTVVQVARTRIRPELDVIPHVLGRPDDGSRGFLVIEIPESAMAPHEVNGTYYGRSEVGKVVLTDTEVEEQILRRGQTAARLRQAMRETLDLAENLSDQDDRVSHMMLTAMPTQPSPGMFLTYTRDKFAQQGFMSQVLMDNLKSINRTYAHRDTIAVAFDQLLFIGRTSRAGSGARFSTWDPARNKGTGGERWLGLADDGTVRYMNLDVGSRQDGSSRLMGMLGSINNRRGNPILYQSKIGWQAYDMMWLIGDISKRCQYRGSWLVGLEVDHLRGLTAEHGSEVIDSENCISSRRVSASDFLDHPGRCANELLRPLFRDLGLENRMPPDD